MSRCILFLIMIINFKECSSIILRGKRARDGQFPWLVQFQTIAPCGGVLLSSDWVLTAAQCVQDKRSSIILFATGLNGTISRQMVPVKAAYIYPQYEAYSVLPDRDHNIALLKLTKPFDMCDTKIILPNILPVKYNDYKSCLIFGWQSYVSPSLKVLAKPIQYSEAILNSWKLCTYMIKTNANYSNVFCTMVESEEEMKACAGNPGSPVVCKNEFHKNALVGIASWTNFSLDCGDLPTYLDLDVFRVWIHNLVLADKEKDSNTRRCEFRGKFNIHNGLWNDTNLLQINYWWQDMKMHLQNGSAANIEETVTENMINDQSNGIYRYEEIGKINSSQSYDQVAESTNLNNSLLCKSKQSDTSIKEQDKELIELDEFEFLLPYELEDAISYSEIIIHPINLYLFYGILWYIFYNIIYIQYITLIL